MIRSVGLNGIAHGSFEIEIIRAESAAAPRRALGAERKEHATKWTLCRGSRCFFLDIRF